MVTLTYGYYNNSVPVWAEARVLNEVRFIESRQTERKTDKLLNGSFYSHLLAKRSIYELTLPANTLNENDNFEFIKHFYEAELWKIDDKNVQLLNDGDLPVDYLEDNYYFKEITLKFASKQQD